MSDECTVSCHKNICIVPSPKMSDKCTVPSPKTSDECTVLSPKMFDE